MSKVFNAKHTVISSDQRDLTRLHQIAMTFWSTMSEVSKKMRRANRQTICPSCLPYFLFLFLSTAFLPTSVFAECNNFRFDGKQRISAIQEMQNLASQVTQLENSSTGGSTIWKQRFLANAFSDDIWFILKVEENELPVFRSRTIKGGVGNVLGVASPSELFEVLDTSEIAVFRNPLSLGPEDDGLWVKVALSGKGSGWILAAPGAGRCEGRLATIYKTASRARWEAMQEEMRRPTTKQQLKLAWQALKIIARLARIPVARRFPRGR
jgi:hypothetical protein